MVKSDDTFNIKRPIFRIDEAMFDEADKLTKSADQWLKRYICGMGIPSFLSRMLVLVILFFNGSLFAQHPVFYELNDENGLPSNEVYSIIQDSFGFIWIGCDAGLYRYDGFNFKGYTNTGQNGTSISFLQLDHKQRVWGKNFYGQVYRTDGDSLKIIYQKKTSIASDPQFTIDESNHLWVYSGSNIIQYSDEGDSITTIHVNSKGKEIVTVQYFNGSIYGVLSNLQVFEINISDKKCKILGDPAPIGVLSRNMSTIQRKDELLVLIEVEYGKIKRNKIYKITNGGLTEFHDFGQPSEGQRIYSIYYEDHLWYNTSEGSRLVGNKYTGLPNEYRLFPDKKISSMLRDREGMLWLGTLHDGIMIIPEPEVLELSPSNSLLPEKAVTCVYPLNNERILIGLYTGEVYEYDRSSFVLKEVYANSDKRFVAVKKICRYEDYTIISRGNLCVIDNRTCIQYFPPVSNIRDFELIMDTLYMVFPTMIAKQSIKDLASHSPGKFIEMRNEGGRAIEFSGAFQTLYVATGSGIYKVLPSNKWIELTNNGRKIYANSMSFQNDILWISTVADGVYGFNRAYDTPILKYHYYKGNVLDDNSVGTMFSNVTGSNIWVSDNRYLYHIDYVRNKIAKYNQFQSIPAGDINQINIVDGTVFLATNKGLIFFNDKLIDVNKTSPNIQLKNISINGKVVDYNGKLTLKYSTKNILIDFYSVALKSKGSFIYKYRLTGLDSNWVEIPSSSSFINFTGLPIGSYSLEIVAVNESGTESEPLIIEVFVAKPFWTQTWFYFLSVMLMGILVALFYNIRIKYIKRKADTRNQLTASQLTALKSQMNPHFLFNTLNSLQDLILKHDIKNSNYYLGKYSTLMRMVLNVSGKNQISISEEIEMLDTYLQLEKLRFGEELTYSISLDPAVDADHSFLPPMLIQPFVENAIKHGLLHKKGPKHLSLRFVLHGSLLCIVEDNGIGRKKADEINARQKEKHQSFAISATKKRIELLNSISGDKYKFTIADLYDGENATGTRVTINL